MRGVDREGAAETKKEPPVLVENFRGRKIAQFGFSAETVAEMRPGIIYTSIRAIDDRLVGRLVRPDLTARLESLADRPADVGGLGVGEGGQRDPVARILRLERVVPLGGEDRARRNLERGE